jgi:hypothetical protein
MFEKIFEYIRTALNNKARDVNKSDRFRLSLMFKGFKNTGIGNRS